MRVPDLEEIITEAERESTILSMQDLVEEWYDMDTEQWYDLKGKLIGDTPIPVVPLPKVTYPVPLQPQPHPIPVVGTSNWIIQYTDSTNRLKAPNLDAPVVSVTSPTSATVFLA